MIGRSPENCTEYRVDHVRSDGKGMLVKLNEFFDRDQVRALTGLTWYEMRDSFPSLRDDEVYLVDLIGMEAVLENDESIGPIIDILDYGPYETFLIRKKGRDVLVPNVDEFVLRIDMEAKQVVIRPIEGLIDG